MRELIDRLAVVDDAAASALRVIEHFDRLVAQRASKAAMARAAAALAGCPVGQHDATTATSSRYGPDGRTLPGPLPDPGWTSVPVPGQRRSRVWMERIGQTGRLDSLILERWAQGLAALEQERKGRFAADLMRVACDPDADESDRRTALAQLGLSGPVTVAVTTSSKPKSPWQMSLGEHTVSLLPGAQPNLDGLRAGISTTLDPLALPTAVEQAVSALRTTDRLEGPGASVVSYQDLGALAALVERFTPDEAAAVPDVCRLEQLREGHPWVVDTLQAVHDQTSMRQAASALLIHHSTLQERLTWLTKRLEYDVLGPGGRQRAAVTLLLWRLADYP